MSSLPVHSALHPFARSSTLGSEHSLPFVGDVPGACGCLSSPGRADMARPCALLPSRYRAPVMRCPDRILFGCEGSVLPVQGAAFGPGEAGGRSLHDPWAYGPIGAVGLNAEREILGEGCGGPTGRSRVLSRTRQGSQRRIRLVLSRPSRRLVAASLRPTPCLNTDVGGQATRARVGDCGHRVGDR